MDDRRNHFDLVRLLAAGEVLVVHAYHLFGLERGRWLVDALDRFPGVPVFFVTSGYLISGAWRRNPDLRVYATNRVLRIYPALWVCFALTLLLAVVWFGVDAGPEELLAWTLAQLTFGQFYNPEFFRPFGVGVSNGNLWTIPVELQFYALLPVMILLLDRLRWRLVVMVAIALVLALVNRLGMHVADADPGIVGKLFGVTIAPHLFAFLCGMVLQRFADSLLPVLRGRAIAFLMLYTVVSLVCGELDLRVQGNWLHPVPLVFLALLVISFAHPNAVRTMPLVGRADLSYGIYIYQMPVINVLIDRGGSDPAWNFLIVLLATPALAYASWHLVERPALSLKRVTSGALPVRRPPRSSS